jgi:glycosyltransferase involved in cell wall biosynthesis
LRRGLARRVLERSRGSLVSRPPGASYFSDDRSQHGGDMLRQALPADILNLHWVAGFVGYREFFRSLPYGFPVVWTLHDMNPFTGGCHHASDCRRFSEHCGCCPQLDSSDPRDFSNGSWERKRRAYDRVDKKRFCVITPSRWLAEEAKRSSLMSDFAIQVVPYGLDTDCFRPQGHEMARESLGVPPNAKVLLFVSHLLSNKYKGAALLVEMVERLRTIPDLFVLSIGLGTLPQELSVPGLSVSTLQTEGQVALAYNAADLFVLPTLQDNFPNTALEALACGLPVVAFEVGGVPEIVRDGRTGLLAKKGNVDGLAKAVESLLNDSERRRTMAANCRQIAVTEYALEVQVRRYVEVYASLIGERRKVAR